MSVSQSTILIIDDQPSIRSMLKEVFEDEGYSVITAANGYDGIQIASDAKPDVILMDMKMPGMNGIETLKEMKLQGQCHKVIVMTAYGEVETIKEIRSVGVCDYVIKPFDIRDLCFMVEKMISGAAAENSNCLMTG